MKKLGLLLTLPLFLAACDTTNPSLTPTSRAAIAARPLEAVTLDDDAPKVTFNPKVDIVFVIDNSDSMATHLKHLASNIKMFTDEISKNKFVDFHIAYTYVHDRSFPQFCGTNQDHPGRQNYDNPGTLQPLEGTTRRFVTNKDDFATILNTTFDKMKLPEYVPYHPWEPGKCAIGPENEESVTPLLALFDPKITQNAEFRRKDAKFVAILVSDAKDAAINSGLESIAGVLEKLSQLTDSTPGHRNFRVFAVAVRPGSIQTRDQVSFDGELSCKPDPAFQIPDGRVDAHNRPTAQWPSGSRTIKVEDSPLAELAMGTEDKGAEHIDQVMSICATDYGKQLALYGARIQMDSLEDKQIILNAPPQIFAKGTKQAKEFGLQVLIDDQPLSKSQWRGEIIGGQYTITIFAKKVDWNAHPNGKITVKYVKVNVGSPDARPIE